MFHSEVVTHGVRVRATSMYVPERSRPEDDYYFFAYRIHIKNESAPTVQLISRHWVITDAEGRAQEVRGPGVIGEQPVLERGEVFEYTSFCPLPTVIGSMYGSFQMVYTEPQGSHEGFDAKVKVFTLADPTSLN